MPHVCARSACACVRRVRALGVCVVLARARSQVPSADLNRGLDFAVELAEEPVLLGLLVLVLSEVDATAQRRHRLLPRDRYDLYLAAMECAFAAADHAVGLSMARAIALDSQRSRVREFSAVDIERALSKSDKARELALWRRLCTGSAGEDGVPLLKLLAGAGPGSPAVYQFRHLSFQEALACQAVVEDGQPFFASGVAASRALPQAPIEYAAPKPGSPRFRHAGGNSDPALAFIKEPFFLNMCRIGVGRLGGALCRGRKSWRLNNLEASSVEALMLLLTENAALSSVVISGAQNLVAERIAAALTTKKRESFPSINLLRCRLSSDTAHAMARVSMSQRISLCGMTDDQLEASMSNLSANDAMLVAASLEFSRTLTSLSLSQNGLTADDAAAIAAALVSKARVHGPMASLRLLDLSCNRIGPYGGVAVAKACAHKAVLLTDLNLAANELCGVDASGDGSYDPCAIHAMAEAMRVSSSLTTLNLAENQVSGVSSDGKGNFSTDAIVAIAGALRGASVTALNLRGNRLGTVGGEILSQGLCGSRSLRLVSLADCNVSVEGGKALAAALHANPALTYMSIANNPLGPAAKTIKAALMENGRSNLSPEDARRMIDQGLAKIGLKKPASASALTGQAGSEASAEPPHAVGAKETGDVSTREPRSRVKELIRRSRARKLRLPAIGNDPTMPPTEEGASWSITAGPASAGEADETTTLPPIT